jgi:hypothetical protein
MASCNNPSYDTYPSSDNFFANMVGRTTRNFQAIQNLRPTEKVLATFQPLVSELPSLLTSIDATDSDEEMEIIFVADNQLHYETEQIHNNSDTSFEQDLLEVHNELEELQREIEQIEQDLKFDFLEANAILSVNTPNLPNNSAVTAVKQHHLPRNTEHHSNCDTSVKRPSYRGILIVGLLWTVAVAFQFYARGYDYKWRCHLPGTQLRPVYDMMTRETSKKKRITRRSSEPLGRTIDELINSPSNIVTNP